MTKVIITWQNLWKLWYAPISLMVEILQIALLILAVLFSIGGINLGKRSPLIRWARFLVAKRITALLVIAATVLLGCLMITGILHEPVPRIHDEFSYLLMANTFVSGHVTNPTPPLPQFFDTFHELMHPVYVSKYFPAQGVFLALGKELTGHPIAGVWLSSALACAAMFWMLEAWLTPTWALFGTALVILQLGIYSYWSQSYWGGMVAALGGALFFGAVRRLWTQFDWKSAIWLALGVVLLVNSRPLEGIVVSLPITLWFALHLIRKRRWSEAGFWRAFIVPAEIVLLLGAAATTTYNRTVTGSPWKAPYMVHEQQYQESPPFIFMSPRPEVQYSSFWLWEYYHLQETQQYTAQRSPALWLVAIARKLRSWWFFYFGILLTPTLVLPGLMRRDGIRYLQMILLVALVVLGITIGNPPSAPSYALVDMLVLAQIGVLWKVFDDFWSRLALATICLLLVQVFFDKWFFPHYFAPATCLILFLQVEGARRIWQAIPKQNTTTQMSRHERRRMAKANNKLPKTSSWRASFVFLLPIICLLSLVIRVEARVNGWSEDFHEPEWGILPLHDWSISRAELDRWLEQQQNPQLVFVRYPLRHNVYFEWVFNSPDIVHSHVIWARDLGTKNDELLVKEFPDRTTWMLDADAPEPQLVPYASVGTTSGFTPSAPTRRPTETQPDW